MTNEEKIATALSMLSTAVSDKYGKLDIQTISVDAVNVGSISEGTRYVFNLEVEHSQQRDLY